MAIKIQGSTIIDDSRNIINSGIATLNYQGVSEVTIGSTNVGIGSTNKFTITPQTTQTAIGIGADELITLASNSGSDNILQVTNASGSIKHFVVTSDGNIGVGTTNPSEKLHIDGNFLVSDGSIEVLEVNGSSGNPLSIQNSSLNPAFDVTGIGSVGIGTTQPSAIFEVVSDGSEIFRISDTVSGNYLEIDTNKFVVNSSGDVGIGTTNPSAIFEVVSGGSEIFRISDTVSDNYLEIDTNKFVVNSSGDVGIGTTNPSGLVDPNNTAILNVGVVTANYIYGDGSNLTGISAGTTPTENTTNQSQFIPFYVGTSSTDVAGISTQSFVFNPSTTRMGIGTDSPQSTLHVVDEFLVSTSGAGSTQRITQKAYTTDNGTLSWEGSAGQLFSVTNNLTSGSIFAVSDVSGIPSIDVDADGTIQLAPFGSTELVGIGTTNPTSKLHVVGDLLVTGVSTLGTLKIETGIVTATSGIITYYGDGQYLSNISFDLVDDTTPQLGGNLDLNSNNIDGTGNIDITGIITATSFVGDGSNITSVPFNSLTGIVTHIVGDTNPQLGGNLDLNSNNIDGTGNIDITGIITATSFEGDGSALTGISAGTTPTENTTNQSQYIPFYVGTSSTDVAGISTQSFVFNPSTKRMGIGTDAPAYNLHVVGDFAATSKSFVIDHPTKSGKKLRYASLEGPEQGVYVRGRSQEAVIDLPDYWTGLVDEESITVNLTPIGHSAAPRVESIANNVVNVFSKEEGELDYYYTVYAERKDIEKLVVEY